MRATVSLILILVLFCMTVGFAQQPAADIFVATNGNDGWSGTLAAPNAGGTDGPLATITRAQRAVEDLRVAEPDRGRPVVVMVRAGTYYLDEPLRFLPEDSGTEASPTVYAAYPDEEPVISGGAEITGWEQTPEGYWRVHLPEVEAGEWTFSQLFVDGQRRYRPRLPKDGYYYIAGEAPPTEEAGERGYDRFRFRAGDLRPDWLNPRDVEVLAFHVWGISRLRLHEVDETRRVVTFTGPTCSMSYWAGLQAGHRYLVENVREALTEPGEWYLDRQSGELTYIPLPGEDRATAIVVAPRLPHLAALSGDLDMGLYVERLAFRGLTFAHTNWVTPEKGNSFPQAEANLGGAITGVGARDCAFEGCRVTQVGEYGIELGEGCKRNRIEGCEITDMGAGGVKLGTQGYAQDEERVASHTTVNECLIAHGGRMHPAAVGVLVLHSPHNVISRNDIHDFYYTGISVGWQWSYAPSHAHHNLIEHNDVHTIGQGVLSDMGGIYTLGPAEGTVIRNNVFSGIESYSYGGRGIYFDQATEGILVENNLVHHNRVGAFCMHFGRENRVVNNIFALSREGVIECVRPEEHNQFDFERNIVYWTEGPLIISNTSGSCYRMRSNVYWNPLNPELTFGDKTFAEWQATGQDEGSLVEDPLFVDPDNGDFTLKPGSPAGRIGFEPFDFRDVGRTQPAPQGPLPPRAFPPMPENTPDLALDEDFELCAVGDKAPGFTTYEDEEVKAATARVTEETAFTGQRSLKLTDLPGQKVSWNPHLFYQTNFTAGVLEGSFALRIEPGIHVLHEWRTAGNPYVVGPSIRIGPDGILRAAGQDLTSIPHGKWVVIAIVCGIGDDADGTWALSIAEPGEAAPRTWDDLPCSAEFTALAWFGFIAEGTEPGAFYLDDIRLHQLAETE